MSETNKKNKNIETETSKNIHAAADAYGKAKEEIPQLGWGGVLGQKDFIRGLGDSFRPTLDIGRGAINMFKAARKGSFVHKLPTDETDPSKRFLFAKDYYGLSDDDIKERIKASCLIFYLAFIAMFADVSLYFYFSWSSTTLINIFTLFPMVSLFFFLFVQCFKYGLINYQMRKKRLCPAKEYIDRNNDWFPPLSGGGKVATFLIVSLPLLFYGQNAFADSNAMLSTCKTASDITVENVLSIPCSKDLWLLSLARLFPNVGPLQDIQTGVTQTYGIGFVSALSAFVAILTSVAVGSLSYQSMIAVVNTAVEGETMGQKWHKVWAPVRICYGFGMLAPITKGGVCMAQVFVLYIALWSGNWGTMVYQAYLQGIENPTSVDPYYITPDATDTLMSIIRLNLCFYSQLYEAKTNGDGIDELWGQAPTTASVNTTHLFISHKKLITINIPTSAEEGFYIWDFKNCGYLKARVSPDAINMVNYHMGHTVNSDLNVLFSNISVTDQTKLNAQNLYSTRAQAITKLNNAIGPVISNIVNTYNSTTVIGNTLKGTKTVEDLVTDATLQDGSIPKAFREYNATMTKAAADFAQQTEGMNKVHDAFQQTVTNNGWMLAGAYYMTVSRMSTQISDILKDKATIGQTSASDAGLDSGDLAKLSENAKGYIERISHGLGQMYGQLNPVKEGNAVGGAKNASETGNVLKYNPSGILDAFMKGGFKEAWEYAFNGLTYVIATGIGDVASVTPGDGSAFQQMVDFGHHLLDFGWGILLLTFLLGQFGPIIKVVAKIGKWLGWASTIFGMATFDPAQVVPSAVAANMASLVENNLGKVIKGLIYLAITLAIVGTIYAYVFPMMPYINFLFFEEGTLALVAECMVAAPILAFLHVRGEGEQLVEQTQRTGYLILFNLFLRIPLGIFGLMLSISIFETTIWLNSILFKIAFNGAISSNAAGLVGIFAYLLLLLYIEWQLGVKSFSLISTMPNKIARWFGAGAEDNNESGHMKEFLAFGINNVGNRVQQTARTAFKDVVHSPAPRSNGGGGGGNGNGGGGGTTPSGGNIPNIPDPPAGGGGGGVPPIPR